MSCEPAIRRCMSSESELGMRAVKAALKCGQSRADAALAAFRGALSDSLEPAA